MTTEPPTLADFRAQRAEQEASSRAHHPAGKGRLTPSPESGIAVRRTRLRPTWSLVIVSTAVAFALGMIVTMSIVATTHDPYHGVPACTNEIADAGGICHGEPR